jgi:hypothetical protein
MNCCTYGYDEIDGSNSIGYHRWPPEIDYAEAVRSSSGKNRIWQGVHVRANGDNKDDGEWIENIDWTNWRTYGCWWKDDKKADIIGFTHTTPDEYPELRAPHGETRELNSVPGDDGGAAWARINDEQHRLGNEPKVLEADHQIPGRVYIGMNGTGIRYGQLR